MVPGCVTLFNYFFPIFVPLCKSLKMDIQFKIFIARYAFHCDIILKALMAYKYNSRLLTESFDLPDLGLGPGTSKQIR